MKNITSRGITKPSSLRSMTLMVLLLVALNSESSNSFQLSPPTFTRVATHHHPSTQLHYAVAADLPASPLFEDRMRKLVLSGNKSIKEAMKQPPSIQEKKSEQPTNVKLPNMYTSLNLQDYKELVGDESERLTVVRFYAPWCSACRRVEPAFTKMARINPNIKFVQVPLSNNDNKRLAEGLGVVSIPFGHVYHPIGGLVEERSMNKKFFADFERIVKSHLDKECLLPEQLDPVTAVYESPYKYDHDKRSSKKQQLEL